MKGVNLNIVLFKIVNCLITFHYLLKRISKTMKIISPELVLAVVCLVVLVRLGVVGVDGVSHRSH